MIDGISHAFPVKHTAAFFVDNLSLFIHNLVIFQKILTDTIVVELDLLLRLFNRS